MTVLIINADDLGYDPGVTEGILASMTEGIVTSTTFMVNTPHSEAAAAAVLACPEPLAIGLHLNLARWHSCAGLPDFVEANAGQLSADQAHRETLGQLNRLRALLGRDATHVDVHKHLHRHPAVLEGVIRAALERHLPVRSMDDATRATLRSRGVPTNDVMLGDAGATAYWSTTQLLTELRALPNLPVVELMCHPGHAPRVEKSGYAAQREVELHAFTSAEAKALAASLPLGNWSALHPRP